MIKKSLKKIAAIIGGIITIWLITPIPEVTIISGLLGGKALTNFVPDWMAWTGAIAGVLIGTVIVRHFNLIEKIPGGNQSKK